MQQELVRTRVFLESLPKDSRVRSHLISSLSELEREQDSNNSKAMDVSEQAGKASSHCGTTTIVNSNNLETESPRGQGDVIALKIHSIIRSYGKFIATTREEVSSASAIPGFAAPARVIDLKDNVLTPSNWRVVNKNSPPSLSSSSDSDDGHCTFSYRDQQASYTLNTVRKNDENNILKVDFGSKTLFKTFEVNIDENGLQLLEEKVAELFPSLSSSMTQPPVGPQSTLDRAPTGLNANSQPSAIASGIPISSRQQQQPPPANLMDPSYRGGSHRMQPPPFGYREGHGNFPRGSGGDFGGDLYGPGMGGMPPLGGFGGGGFGGGGNLMGPNHPGFAPPHPSMMGGPPYPSNTGFPQPRYDPITPGDSNPNPFNIGQGQQPVRGGNNFIQGEPGPDHLRPPVPNEEHDDPLRAPPRQQNSKSSNNNPPPNIYF